MLQSAIQFPCPFLAELDTCSLFKIVNKCHWKSYFQLDRLPPHRIQTWQTEEPWKEYIINMLKRVSKMALENLNFSLLEIFFPSVFTQREKMCTSGRICEIVKYIYIKNTFLSTFILRRIFFFPFSSFASNSNYFSIVQKLSWR